MSDPFDFPFPQRGDLMSLSTIGEAILISGSGDVGAFGKKAGKTFSGSLYTSDIKGAQPTLKPYSYTNKTSFINKNDDIAGSHPRRLIREGQLSSYQLVNEDINGTKPSINKFKTIRKPTNPLNPEYILPKVEIKPSSPLKFIRDSIDVSDIEGTRPRKVDLIQELNAKNKFLGRTFEKKPLDEIPGTRPKKMFIPKDGIDILNVNDINSFRQFKTTRVVNPLEPRYIVGDENKQKIEIGEIPKSKSRVLHPYLQKEKDFNLKTGDIHGAWADTHADLFLRRGMRTSYRNNIDTSDVDGANVGSLKKGMESLRHTNPLFPKYQYIGEGVQVSKEEGSKIQPLNEATEHSAIPAPVIKEKKSSGNKEEVNSRKSEKSVPIVSPKEVFSEKSQKAFSEKSAKEKEKVLKDIKRPKINFEESANKFYAREETPDLGFKCNSF